MENTKSRHGKFYGTVTSNKDSVVRPGSMISNSDLSQRRCMQKSSNKQGSFYSRDYCMLAYPEEKVEASGIVEVKPKQ